MSDLSNAVLLRISSFIDGLVRDARTNGAGLAVAVDGQPIFEHFAGCARADLDAGPAVLWPVASISKLYTAAAIMRQVERGQITLGIRVSTVLPSFSGGGRESITLRQLLTHTSGLPYESPQMADRLSARVSIDEIFDEACSLDLKFQPGTSQLYSDLGYAVAGRLAASVAGRAFEELVYAEVLQPAGLAETYIPPPASGLDRIATVEGSPGYGADTAMYNSAYALSLAHPAFGVVATLSDLLKFGLLFEPSSTTRIHSTIALRIMTTDQTGGDFPAEDVVAPTGTIHPWGIGFMIKGRTGYPELVSPVSFGHGGASGCYLWSDPQFGVTIAFVSNRHYTGDPVDFMPRLDQAINMTMACLTR